MFLNSTENIINLYKIYPHEYGFDGKSPPDKTTPHISTKKKATISKDRGANISAKRGAPSQCIFLVLFVCVFFLCTLIYY